MKRGSPASSTSAPAARGAAAEPRAAAERWADQRRLYLDNLKVLLIAAIIAGHAIAGYSALELWAYGDVREATLSPVTDAVLTGVFAPFGLFMVPLLFLVAGLLTPGSLARKGQRRYVRDRLLRLGLPFAVFTLLIWPAVLYALYRPLGNAGGSYWAEFVGTTEEGVDTGYLWFVGDLLIFSLGYAGWARVRNRRGAHAARDMGAAHHAGSVRQPGLAGHPGTVPTTGAVRQEVTVQQLLLLAGAVTLVTFLVRLVFPFDSQKYVDLNLFQWPECLAVFALGIAASRWDWLTAVPGRLRTQCRTVTLVAVGAFGVFVVIGALLGGLTESTWTGGWHVEALAMAVLESVLSVCGPVWMLGAAQRHLDRPLRWVGPAVARSAYGAFLLQGLLLLGLAVALRPLPLPAEGKALVVAVGAVTGSFALAWLLVSKVRGLARVL
ncbi:MAG TPA: acyltransferase [Dermatophilaceae bacterium]|nr:acyltransferase [Dermatophilaceae bacterium]